MASSKKPTYKVEIKPINERKRRKSDLVIMWQSIWDLSLYILSKCWNISTRLWDMTNDWIKEDEKKEIQTWLRRHLPTAPADFSDSWRDGVLLSILLNKLQPGCYPDADNLDINFGLRNVFRAFNILESRFNIIPKMSVEEVVTCSSGSDSKLQELLLQLKHETDNFPDGPKKEKKSDQKDQQLFSAYDSKRCIAKGTGLLVGFVGREANFVVFYASLSELDLVIEIKGPSNSFCCERITKRSPKRKKSVKLWKPSQPSSVARSLSDNSSIYEGPEVESEFEKRYIPTKYEIHANQISFSYRPLMKGHHRVSILCNGQHISDSPYVVTVEPPVGAYKNQSLKSVLKQPSTLQSISETDKKEPVRFQESENKSSVGKVIKRRVLRYIVKINKKDIEVDADGIDHLASALLKMDYELQKRPLSRRNSWGFVGDAERKVSMIRQFCVDQDELEAQCLKMHRSLSLTFNKPKCPFPKSGSYECEDILTRSKLETVTEGKDLDSKESLLQRCDSEMLQYLNEEFDSEERSFNDCEEMTSHENETNRRTEALKDSEDENPKNIGLNPAVMDNPNQNSNQGVPGVFEQVKNQDLKPIELSPNNFLLENELYERLYSNSNDAKSSPFIDIFHDQTPSNSISHQNLERCSKTESTTISSLSSEKKETCPYNDIKNCTTEPYSLDTIDVSVVDVNGNERVLVDEKPFTKSDAKNVQSSSYVHGEQISPIVIKSRIKDDKENNFGYFGNETSKAFNFQCDQNTKLGSESYGKEKENLHLFMQNNYLNQSNTISSRTRTKKRKNNFDRIQKRRNKISRKDAVLQNSKHFSLSKVTQDTNFKLENKAERSESDNRKNNPNILKQSPKKFYSVSERFSDLVCTSNNHNLLMNSQEKNETSNSKISENTIPTYRRISDTSIKNNHIQSMPENILSRGHSTPKIELDSPILSWNFPSPIINQHHSNKTNLNRINSLVNQMTTNIRRIEKPLKPSNVVSEVCNVNQEPTETKFSIRKRTLVSLGQFNFRHFNPAFQSNREGPVKARIKQWQNRENEALPTIKTLHKLETLPERGNIAEKLMFWENVHRKQNEIIYVEKELSSECNEGLNKPLNVKQTTKENKNINIVMSASTHPYKKGYEEDVCQKPKAEHGLPESTPKENLCSLNTENTFLCEKRNEGKLSIPVIETRIRKRSFSDPGGLETSKNTNGLELSEQFEILHEPSREDMSSSTDVNYLELSADDEISSVDLLYSTEDEYIDDEISESASTYWGDLSFIKSLKLANSVEYQEFCSLIESGYGKDRRESILSNPYECKVFGIANYFGHVAVKNRFRVLTNGAGNGNLSATVQGLGQHEVSFVSVEYVQKDVYEVTYQVLTPGLYLISVRWMENPISGSPFLCKVTF